MPYRFSLRSLFVWVAVFSIVTAVLVVVGKRVHTVRFLVNRVESPYGAIGVDGPTEVFFSVQGLHPLVTDVELGGTRSVPSLGQCKICVLGWYQNYRQRCSVAR